MTDTIVRTKVTWNRWDDRRLQIVTSHPTVWVWTDDEGTSRCYDTKREAEADRDSRKDN